MVAGKSNTAMLAFPEHLSLGSSALGRRVYGRCLCSLREKACREALSSSDGFHICVCGGSSD